MAYPAMELNIVNNFELVARHEVKKVVYHRCKHTCRYTIVSKVHVTDGIVKVACNSLIEGCLHAEQTCWYKQTVAISLLAVQQLG